MVFVRLRVVLTLGAVVLCSALAAPAPAAPTGSAQVRPNLVPLPPTEMVGPTTGLLGASSITSVAPVVVEGCYPEEMARTGARRCLRVDTHIVNEGDGPLEVAYVIDGPDIRAMQHVYLRDGSYVARRAADSEFHPTHTHFHIKDFYISKLWATKGGAIAGRKPVSVTRKNGFCPEDSSRHSTGKEPRYRCRDDVRTEGGVSEVVGISAGYMDTYGYALPDQFLEITGVPDGRYLLEVVIDPDDNFVESSERDNRTCVEIVLKGDEATVGAVRERCS